MAAGIRLSRWLGREAKRIYAMLSENNESQLNRQLVEWIYRKGGRVTVRQVQQGRRDCRTAEEARAALDRLTKAGFGDWESAAPGKKGGRPSETFVLLSLARPERLSRPVLNEDDWITI